MPQRTKTTNERMLQRTMLQRKLLINKIRRIQEHRCYNEQFLSIKSGCYNEQFWSIKSGSYKNTDATMNKCYNEVSINKIRMLQRKEMLQRTVSINKIRMLQRTQMLQRTRRNTIGRRSTRVRMTCRFQKPRIKQSNLDSFFKQVDKSPPTDERHTGQSPKMRRNDDSSPPNSMWFFMLLIRDSLFAVFTKERLFVLFKFTCTVYKS